MYGMVADRVASAVGAAPRGVVINEIAPATGANDKWIELYNPTNETVSTSGWRFVLNETTSVSPVIPSVEIAPGGFYVYVPNSLTPQSRTLELRSAASEYEVIDQVTYPLLQNGQSYARTADGVGAFEIREAGSATRGASNTSSVVDEDEDPETPAAPEESETPDTPEVPETPEQVTPIINKITPNEGNFISSDKQRIDIDIANPEVVKGGWLQLNKVVEDGQPANSDRDNYRIVEDEKGWHAIVDTTGLDNADYLFKVEVHHKYGHDGQTKPWGYYGNNSAWQYPSYYFTVDNIAPTFSLTMFGKKDKKHVPLTNGAIINPDLFDASSLLNTIRFSKESANDTLFANGEPVFGHGYNADNDEQRGGRTGNIGTRFSEEGVYEIYTRDAAGNQSSSVTFTVDKTAPQAEIEVSSPAGAGDLHRDTVRVTGVVDPVEQNMKSHWIEVRNPDGTLSYAHNMSTNDLSYSFDLDTSAGDGEYHIRYVATDKAGNRNDVDGSTTRTITVDNAAPAISGFEFENIKNGKYNPTKVIARVAEDDGSRSAEVYLNVYKKDEDGVWKQQAGVFTQGGPNGRDFVELTATDSRYKADGVYRLEAWAKDQAGNVGDKKVSREFTVDKADPETTIEVSKNDQGLVGKTFTVSGEAKDNDALNRVYVQLIHRESNTRYGGTTVNLIPYGAGPHQWSVEYDAAELNLPEGTYAAHVSVVDRAGNSTASDWTDDFTLDTTMPTLLLNGSAGSDRFFGPGSIGAAADKDDFEKLVIEKLNDNGEYKTVHTYTSWNGTANLAWMGTNNDTERFGNATYRAQVFDKAGNGSNATIFTIDTIKPVIKTPEVAEYLRGEQTFNITQDEAHPARAYVEYMKKDANGDYKKLTGEWKYDTNDLSYAVDTAEWADGEYQVKISTWDKANNHTSAAFQFAVDNTAPATTVQKNADGRAFSGVIDVADTSNYVRVTFYQLGADGNTVKGENGAPIVLLTDTARVLGGAWSYQISDENLARFALNGGYRVNVRTYDNLGNTDATWINYQFTYAPEVPGGEDEGDDDSTNTPAGGTGNSGVRTEPLPTVDNPHLSTLSSIITSTAAPSTLGTAFGLSTATALAQTPASPQTQNNQEVLGLTTGSSEGSVLGVADESDEQWSLVNAAAAIITTLLSLMALAGLRRKTDEEDGRAPLRLFTIIPAAVALVAFFATETLSAPMVWVNMWTWLFGAAVILQIILVAAARRSPAGE